uniref:Uncharacterized protein n=1 Tax=Klebsiella pneumoniae TaxID=573 RepID=A0A8B0SV28_KLEPN|nr:hypothetical protein [Klebsiella pneumoniae]
MQLNLRQKHVILKKSVKNPPKKGEVSSDEYISRLLHQFKKIMPLMLMNWL